MVVQVVSQNGKAGNERGSTEIKNLQNRAQSINQKGAGGGGDINLRSKGWGVGMADRNLVLSSCAMNINILSFWHADTFSMYHVNASSSTYLATTTKMLYIHENFFSFTESWQQLCSNYLLQLAENSPAKNPHYTNSP